MSRERKYRVWGAICGIDAETKKMIPEYFTFEQLLEFSCDRGEIEQVDDWTGLKDKVPDLVRSTIPRDAVRELVDAFQISCHSNPSGEQWADCSNTLIEGRKFPKVVEFLAALSDTTTDHSEDCDCHDGLVFGDCPVHATTGEQSDDG